MKSIKEIFNKEMVRVFKDKKMVFSVFFLPVIIMIGIMTSQNTSRLSMFRMNRKVLKNF